MGNKKPKRVLVTFTAEQWEALESMRGELGRSDADIVRNIVVFWLMNAKYGIDQKKVPFLQGELNE